MEDTSEYTTCPRCNGTGDDPEVTDPPDDDIELVPAECGQCHGDGFVDSAAAELPAEPAKK